MVSLQSSRGPAITAEMESAGGPAAGDRAPGIQKRTIPAVRGLRLMGRVEGRAAGACIPGATVEDHPGQGSPFGGVSDVPLWGASCSLPWTSVQEGGGRVPLYSG